MFVDTIPNRKSPPTHLLRESVREGGKTRKRTLLNLSSLPEAAIAALKAVLSGKKLVSAEEHFVVEKSLPHGHIEVVKLAMKRLGIAELVASKSSRERDLVLAMIAQRIIAPRSKLESVARFGDTTLGQEFGVEGVDENDLYGALDWLVGHQKHIERKLSKRHLGEGARVFYDVSSSSYHGTHCPLAARGYNRDGLKLPSIVYGLLTDDAGRPIAIRAYPGNTGDPMTVPDQISSLREDFGVGHFVVVGDRGMLTSSQIDKLREAGGCGWISCLRSGDIGHLLEAQDPSDAPLFSQSNLVEITHPDFPDERLIACYNELLAMDRKHTRKSLLEATEARLEKLRKSVERRTGKPFTEVQTALKAGPILEKYKMKKHFVMTIKDNHLSWKLNADSIAKEATLDGIYVVRTSEKIQDLSAADAVRAYKNLGNVEKAFRTFKGLDLRIRPIHHRLENRVRAHIFLCMMAYYVEWHMRQALAPILYAEENINELRQQRDPVAKAQSSSRLRKKRTTKKSQDDIALSLRSWDGVLCSLSTLVRNSCRAGDEKVSVIFPRDTQPNAFQQKIFQLLKNDAPFWFLNPCVL